MEVGATLIIVPVLRRPHRVAPLLASIAAATPEPHSVLFVCTEGDIDEIVEVRRHNAEHITIPANDRGDYAIKINTGYRLSVEPFLFCGADDLDFHDGWLTAAMAKMVDQIGVVGTNDLGNSRVIAGEHSTHSLVRRSYADDLGTIDERRKILHEGYWHDWVDDELVATAKRRNAWSFAGDSIVEHLHPNWNKAPSDALYAPQAQRMRYGRKVFRRREHLWS